MFTAKMYITEVKDHPEYKSKSLMMAPLISDESEENKSYSLYTPSGQLMLNISNPNLFPELVVGKRYVVTFQEVDK